MKLFQEREQREAIAFARAGGQALHLIGTWATARPGCPRCFKTGTGIAHLFDQDLDRLVLTAKSLGVRVIKVERAGHDGMHVDLCRKPLAKARDLCATPEFEL